MWVLALPLHMLAYILDFASVNSGNNIFIPPIFQRRLTTNYHTVLETHSYSLLHYGSFHPHYLKNQTPYGQFQRLQRICDRTLMLKHSHYIGHNVFKTNHIWIIISTEQTEAASTGHRPLPQQSKTY